MRSFFILICYPVNSQNSLFSFLRFLCRVTFSDLILGICIFLGIYICIGFNFVLMSDLFLHEPNSYPYHD